MANPPKFGMQTVMGGIQITAASPAVAASLSPGLSPADFERFAAQIKPIWELDDAPFAATAAMDAVDLAALQGGGGANAEVAAALNGMAPDVLPSDLLITEPVLPFAAPSSQPMSQQVAQQVPQQVAQLVPQPVANGVSHHPASQPPTQPPARMQPAAAAPRAQQISAASYLDDDLAIKKSKTPLIIGAVVGLAVIGTIIGAVVGMSGSSTPATPDKPVATVTTAAPKDIPPPPPVAEIPPPAEAKVDPKPPVAVAPPPAPPHVSSLPPLPPATHPAQAAPPKSPHGGVPPALRPPPASAPPKPPKAGGGGIVRDNPF